MAASIVVIGAPNFLAVAPECSRKLISGLNDAERDAKPAKQPGHARATDPKKAPRSRYRIDPEAIAAGRLPETVPVVTSATNPHYQKYFDRLFGLAKAGDWDAVRDYRITGSNSYSKMVARYRQDLLALHAASEVAR